MSQIWVPKHKIIEPKREFSLRNEFEGWYRLKVVGPDGVTIRRDTGWFKNIITDVGLNLLGSHSFGDGAGGQCRAGTGNATPAVTDTALQTQIATTTNVTSFVSTAQGSAPYYGALTIVYRFAQGAAAGNIAEVGVGQTGGVLFSRALVLDGGGSPTTITVLSDEFLDVTYQIRLKPPTSDFSSSVVISGVTYNYTIRASFVTNSLWWGNAAQLAGGKVDAPGTSVTNGSIGAITSGPSGTSSNPSGITNSSYVNNSLVRDFTVDFGLGNGNVSGGVSAMIIYLGALLGGFGLMQMSFSPAIPKDSTKLLSFTFRHSWARGTP